jgi:hypothetical protein
MRRALIIIAPRCVQDGSGESSRDAMAEAQRAARESLAERRKLKTTTDRYISEAEYAEMYHFWNIVIRAGILN